MYRDVLKASNSFVFHPEFLEGTSNLYRKYNRAVLAQVDLYTDIHSRSVWSRGNARQRAK